MADTFLKYFYFIIICVYTFSSGYLLSQKRDNYDKPASNNLQEILNWDISCISINKIEYFLMNNDISPNNIDFIGPPYTDKIVMNSFCFSEGPLLSGKINDSLKIIGSMYNNTFKPGRISVNDDPRNPDPKIRIYHMRNDWVNVLLPFYPDEDLYKDYREWPVDDGAPYQYDSSGKKIPKFIGDEQLWWVMNDKVSYPQILFGTPSLGTEWEVFLWEYNKPGALNYTLFKKYRIINKSNCDIKDCYFSYYVDPDVGFGIDDLVGCDTTINMGYAYNGNTFDKFYGISSPALGYIILQGPIVKSDNINDEANWNFQKKKGYKNLPLTAFTFFAYNFIDTNYKKPSFDLKGGKEFYNLQKGLKKNGTNWINPQTGINTPFIFPGDPFEGKGWIDGMTNNPPLPPREESFLISSGPFNLMKNDTQEIVIAIIVGNGSDRLSSVNVLKYYASNIKSFFDNGLSLGNLKAPESLSSASANKVDLYWDKNSDLSRLIEEYNVNGYKFEGYNVYQLPYSSSEKDKAVRIATFDIKNGIKSIFENTFDSTAGIIINKQVEWGNDSGIKREITINKDFIHDRPLINGRNYCFSVTAYAYKPDATPSIIETPLNIIECMPEGKKSDVPAITVYPNPYYGSQEFESDQYHKFITFNHLPRKAIIKIYSLSGSLVKTIKKDDDSQFARWNLLNDNNVTVASGMYIACIEMPEIKTKKTLKFAIIMENIIPDRI
jgi:hypothetical protein